MGGLLGNQRDRLDPRRAGADDRNALAGELDLLMWPAAGEINLTFEVFDAIDLRRLGRGEAAGGHDVVAAGDGIAVVSREQPAFCSLVPSRGRHLGIKADLATQVIAVRDKTEIAQDLGLGSVL